MRKRSAVIAYGVLIAAFAGAKAIAAEPVCELEDPTTVSKTYFSDLPSYFFRVFPKKKWVSFHGDRNTILDLESQKTLSMPGDADPVPLWNEEVMTTPLFTKVENKKETLFSPDGGMGFYSVQEVQEKGLRAKPLFVDRELLGQYQSIGALKPAQNGVETYRILTDQDGLSYRDYQVSKAGEQYSVSPLGKRIRLCPDRQLSTPMLSKDGTEVAALDRATNTTKLFKVGANGACTQILDLGIETGKVDFSFDGKKLAFHVSNTHTLDNDGNYLERPSRNSQQAVYVLDLGSPSDPQSRTLYRVSPNSDSNAYYPVFRPDGTVAYLYAEYQGKSDFPKYSFVVADPSRAKGVSYSVLSNCPNCGPNLQQGAQTPLLLLGNMWAQLCRQGASPSAPNAVLAALTLNPEGCRKLAQDTWQKWKSKIDGGANLPGSLAADRAKLRELTLNDVLAACPKETAAANKPVVIGSATPASGYSPKSASEVFARKCTMCHGNTLPFEDPKALASKPSNFNKGSTVRAEILRRINASSEEIRMPKGGQLNPTEIKLIEDYLK